MNKSSKSTDFIHFPKELPSREYSFKLDIKGAETGAQYVGEFTFTIPSLKAKSNSAVLYCSLNRKYEEDLDSSVLTLHSTISFLRHALTKYPEWWKENDFGLDLCDFNVVEKIYLNCMDYLKEYNGKIFGEKPKKSS